MTPGPTETEYDLLVLGAGGHARSVLDIILQCAEYRRVACLSPSFPQNRQVEGMPEVPIVGVDEDLPKWYERGLRRIFIAVGDNHLRRRLFDRARNLGFELINVISPQAVISPRARLGRGICVMAGAVLNVNTVVEDNCIINTRASVDHDGQIGHSCHLAPGVTLSGCVRVGEGSMLGTGASVIDGVCIGPWSLIGAGAVCVNDIGSRVLCLGVPARVARTIDPARE